MAAAGDFSPSRFLKDIEATTDLLGIDHSPPMTRRVLDTYEESFHRGAVLWRTNDKPGGALNYRFYDRVPVDTVRIGVRAGLLRPDSPSVGLISAWSSRYEGSTELCDFDAVHGLVKTWVYLGGIRPLDEILDVPGVPDAIRRHRGRLHELGLTSVRHVAVDYQHDTANLYFRTREGLGPKVAERLLALSRAGVPDETTLQDMVAFTAPDGHTFSVTLRISTGAIERVGIYALRLPAGRFPRVNDRLAAFFRGTPSHDEEEMNAIAWSFGAGGGSYVKAERSYCGRLVALMREWNSPMTDPGRRP
ncbi:aromatic prenyltransferase [Kitasatospora brasiliensis]|uniref:aromatic prenyltransferase n=1 Tax=Kitasatospora brasiliensis TaxID=3058040 RepID=UPI0029311CDD|nr:aromatic prenyltransferase [Kitasatospora sp. K002]